MATHPPEAERWANPWKFVPTLYFLQGIPNVVVTTVAVALYKRLGVPNDQLAVLTSLMALPWTLKPLWGPMVDNSGTKRGWILWTQMLIALGLGVAAAAVSTPAFLLITLIVFFLVAFLSATHDIAADGFYLLALEERRQAAYVGVRSLFFRLAMVFGSGFLVAYAGNLEKAGLPAGSQPPAGLQNAPAWVSALLVGAAVYGIFWLYNVRALPRPSADEPHEPPKVLPVLTSLLQIIAMVFGLVMFGRWLVILAAWVNEAIGMKMLVTPSANLTPIFLPKDMDGTVPPAVANYLSPVVLPFAIQALVSLGIIAVAVLCTRSLFKRIGMGPAAAEYFSQEKIMAVLAFILFYRFGESMISKMSQPFLLDPRDKGGLGVATQAVGVLWGTVGVAALALGGILGGWLIANKGLKKSLWPMVLSLNIPNLFYLWLAFKTPTSPLSELIVADKVPFIHLGSATNPLMDFLINIPSQLYNLGLLIWLSITDPIGQVIFVDQFGYGFGFAAYMVYLMFISQGAKFKTSHYAISTGLMALGATVAGAMSGALQQSLGWRDFFLAVCLLTIPGMLTLFFIPMKGPDLREPVAID